MKKIFIILFLVAFAGIGLAYYCLFQENVIDTSQNVELKIRKGDTWQSVENQIINSGGILHKQWIFRTVKLLKYDKNIRSGRYVFNKEMSAVNFVRKLRSGHQDAVNLVINNINFPEDLASRISSKLDIDSTEWMTFIKNDSIAESFGFDIENFWAMFLSNSYQIYWNTDQEALAQRMKKEYDTFWNESKKEQAKKINLTPQQVVVLASIVQRETNFRPEYANVASVYLNRLKIGMPLQADPTVKFALNDIAIKRILKKDLEIDSPYNTYKYIGLPPGPICLPELDVVNGVLNATSSNYLYFCAVFGENRHVFTSSYTAHLKNARIYQNELNKQGVYR
ncbi:MAG: endolytic transglycosylase MltG [Chitinophagales bacterium]|nr:endolytic transglycosylase MltG [Chitinophagales bacterium]